MASIVNLFFDGREIFMDTPESRKTQGYHGSEPAPAETKLFCTKVRSHFLQVIDKASGEHSLCPLIDE